MKFDNDNLEQPPIQALSFRAIVTFASLRLSLGQVEKAEKIDR